MRVIATCLALSDPARALDPPALSACLREAANPPAPDLQEAARHAEQDWQAMSATYIDTDGRTGQHVSSSADHAGTDTLPGWRRVIGWWETSHGPAWPARVNIRYQADGQWLEQPLSTLLHEMEGWGHGLAPRRQESVRQALFRAAVHDNDWGHAFIAASLIGGGIARETAITVMQPTQTPASPFRLCTPHQVPMRTGDLLCTMRSGAPQDADTFTRCHLVTGIERTTAPHPVARVVGTSPWQALILHRLQLDADGRLLPGQRLNLPGAPTTLERLVLLQGHGLRTATRWPRRARGVPETGARDDQPAPPFSGQTDQTCVQTAAEAQLPALLIAARNASVQWETFGRTETDQHGNLIRRGQTETDTGSGTQPTATWHRVLRYWEALDPRSGKHLRQATRNPILDEGARQYMHAVLAMSPSPAIIQSLWRSAVEDTAWSGVFLSSMLQSAGIPPAQYPVTRHDFAYALRAVEQGPLFRACSPHATPPRTGDLLCRIPDTARQLDRDAFPANLRRLGFWDQTEVRCGIVAGITRRQGQTPGVARLIGGDVADSIARSSLPLAPDGTLSPPRSAGAARGHWLLLQGRSVTRTP